MNTIKQKDLEVLVNIINIKTGSPLKPYENGKSNVGNYHLSGAYGGWSLIRMLNEGGGVSEVFSSGHVPKRDLYNRMSSFIDGLNIKTKC